MLIVQITDLHIMLENRLVFGEVDTTACLARAIDHLNALDPRPDLALLTGDLVDAGSPGEYARLRAQLARLPIPYRVIPGNHDARDALRAAFPDHPYLRTDAGFCHYVDESWPVRLVGLDSLEPNLVEGVMCAQRLAWLDRVLAAQPEKPTLVCIHHPPFTTGVAHLDALTMRGADDFAAIITRHRQVERVVCGHVHRSMSARWGGTLCTTCPSTAHQFALDLGAATPARWTTEPPGFQLHRWRPETGFVTHTGLIGPFAVRSLRH